MTSALYPYVHTRASGISCARYSSGQKIWDGGGGDEAGEERECACVESSDNDLAVRLLNKDLKPPGFLVVLLPMPLSLPLFTLAACQVPWGWPRRPWTNITLEIISRLMQRLRICFYFKQNWSSLCSPGVSLVKPVRCTFAIALQTCKRFLYVCRVAAPT